jgi:hypothetical protein
MDKEYIAYGNNLIAQFMGLTYRWVKYPNPQLDRWEVDKGCYWSPIYYNESWDWLMPVVAKINAMGKAYHLAIFKTYNSMSVEKGGKMYKDYSFAHATTIDPEKPIESLFELIVKFIAWHNEQMQNNI